MAKTSDYGLGEFTYPRGWFMVARSEDLTNGVVSARYFGDDMVIYRGASGEAHMLDAYCPHMGTHLGRNTTSYVIKDATHIEGDNIRCPYHGWRFGPDGRCNQIPYSPLSPPKAARVKRWTLVERAGCLWTWYDPEGGEPDYELPVFEDYNVAQWVNWNIRTLGDLDCHPQEVVDNIADKAHLEPVHGSVAMVSFENEFAGHVCRQVLSAGHKTLAAGGEPMTNDTWYTGPGILQSVMIGANPSLMLIAHTPIEDGKVRVWYGLMVKAANAEPTADDTALARSYEEAGVYAFAQDFEIWANKRPCFNPMMVRGDGPFDKVRIWYRQFFNPRAQAESFQKRVDGRYTVKGTKEAPWESAV